MFKHGVLVERGCPFFSFVPPCFVFCSEGWKEALPPFESMMVTVGRMIFPDFVVCMWEERAKFA